MPAPRPLELPSELPDHRDPELETLARDAVRIYNEAKRDTRLDEFGESFAWMRVDEVCFTLSVLHNAWLEMKPRLSRNLPTWPDAQAQIALDARMAYDALLLQMFAPSGSTLTRPSFGVGYGYGHRRPPPSRSPVEQYVCETMEWWWLCELRAMADTRLPKGFGVVLDSVPVLRRASPTPPTSPTSSPILATSRPDESESRAQSSTDTALKLDLDSAYAHKVLHAVIGWRANAQLGVLALHVERARWVWYSDFRPSAAARKVLTDAGVSPLLMQVGLPGMLRGDAHR